MREEFGMSARKAGVFAWLVTGLALAVSPSALAESALHKAARAGNLAEVQKLLDSGADVNSIEQGKTPLHHAALINPNPEVVQALLDAGAQVGLKGHNDMTALHFAVVNPTPMSAHTQSNAEARNKSGETARRLEVIQLLLDAGATTYAKNEDGLTPLHLAAGHYWDPEIVDTLLLAGAFVDARAENDATPLHFAAAFNGNPEVARLLSGRRGRCECAGYWGPDALAFGVAFQGVCDDRTDVAGCGRGCQCKRPGRQDSAGLSCGERKPQLASGSQGCWWKM